ncbi:hypothetical protein FRC04_012204 [Tulasnella sp. 424]|nr:hypothetical protein FRC04_012204 [Tulasnella sp. 424]
MQVEAFFPEIRWELSTENVLATQMLDTLIPSIERHIIATAGTLVEFNSGIINIYPVSRREELMEYEKDLRVQHSMSWTALQEYVIPAIEAFLVGSSRLFDSANAQILPKGLVLSNQLSSLRREAALAATRCNQVKTRLQPLGSTWASFHKTLDFYAAHPIPEENRVSLVGQFMAFVFQQEPLHSSPEEYGGLLDSARRLAEECAALHATLENLADFFRKMVRQYDDSGHNPTWSSRLDFRALGERWRRIHGQVGRCRKSIPEHQTTLATLHPPFIFHDDVPALGPATAS